MDNNTPRAYLEFIAKQIEEKIGEYIIKDGDDGECSLIFSIPVFEDDTELGYEIIVNEEEENIFLTQILLFAFTEVNEKISDQIQSCLTALNAWILPGCFIYDRSLGTIIYRCGYYLNGNTPLNSVIIQLDNMLMIMEKNLSVVVDSIGQMLRMEITADQFISELDKMNDNGEK